MITTANNYKYKGFVVINCIKQKTAITNHVSQLLIINF